MLCRKSFLTDCRYFFKALHGLWIPAVVFINVVMPIINFCNAKLYDAVQETAIKDMLFFFIPISSVWAAIFIAELFFSEKTKDALFFCGRSQKLLYTGFFYLVFLADGLLVALAHFPVLEDTIGLTVKIACVCVFYFGVSVVLIRVSKSATYTIMLLILYALANILLAGKFNFFLFYSNGGSLEPLSFCINYVPLLILGTLGVFFAFYKKSKYTNKK